MLAASLLLAVLLMQTALGVTYRNGWAIYKGDDIPIELRAFVAEVRYCASDRCGAVVRLILSPLGTASVALNWSLGYWVAAYVTGNRFWRTVHAGGQHPRSTLSVAKEIVAHCLDRRTSMNIQYYFEGLSPFHQFCFGL
jgi:hypothetical protein